MGGGCLLFFRVFVVVVVFLLYILLLLLLLLLLAFLLFLYFTNIYHKTICFSFFSFYILLLFKSGLGNHVINSILNNTHQFIIGQYTNA